MFWLSNLFTDRIAGWKDNWFLYPHILLDWLSFFDAFSFHLKFFSYCTFLSSFHWPTFAPHFSEPFQSTYLHKCILIFVIVLASYHFLLQFIPQSYSCAKRLPFESPLNIFLSPYTNVLQFLPSPTLGKKKQWSSTLPVPFIILYASLRSLYGRQCSR